MLYSGSRAKSPDEYRDSRPFRLLLELSFVGAGSVKLDGTGIGEVHETLCCWCPDFSETM